MLREKFQSYNPWYVNNGDTPKKSIYREKLERPWINEWNLAICGLLTSLLVIVTKLFYQYRVLLQKLFVEQRLISFEVLSDEGEVMLMYTWTNVVKFSRFWLPVLCGVLTTYFTWIMVYLDSNVPGVQPPSPFSPKKFKDRSGHTFHLNYVFAVIIGILVTFYTYWKEISISF